MCENRVVDGAKLLFDLHFDGFGVARKQGVGQYDNDDETDQFRFRGHTLVEGRTA